MDFVQQHGAGEEQYDVDAHMTCSKTFEQNVKRLKTTGTAYNVQFRDLDDVQDIHAFFAQATDSLLDQAFSDAKANDRVGLEIRHPGLDTPILIPFGKRSVLDAETIVRHLEQVQQSKTEFNIDEKMVWQFTRIEAPVGWCPGQPSKRKYRGNLDTWLEEKSGAGGSKRGNKSLVKIDNKDNLCLARAVVTAIARLERRAATSAGAAAANRSRCSAAIPTSRPVTAIALPARTA